MDYFSLIKKNLGRENKRHFSTYAILFLEFISSKLEFFLTFYSKYSIKNIYIMFCFLHPLNYIHLYQF